MKKIICLGLFTALCVPFATASLAMPIKLDASAVEDFRHIMLKPHAEDWEYSSILILQDNAYWYPLIPHTDKQKDAVYLFYGPDTIPEGGLLAAILHTHPCFNGYLTGFFSIPDVMAAYYYKVPSFVLDECTGDVHEFNWAVDRPHDTGKDVDIATKDGSRRVHLPAGRIVGNIGRAYPKQEMDREQMVETAF